jgi:small subunit ribosomal protein S1
MSDVEEKQEIEGAQAEQSGMPEDYQGREKVPEPGTPTRLRKKGEPKAPTSSAVVVGKVDLKAQEEKRKAALAEAKKTNHKDKKKARDKNVKSNRRRVAGKGLARSEKTSFNPPAPVERIHVPESERGLQYQDEGMSFAEMLGDTQGMQSISISVGDKVQGRVVHIGQDSVFLSLSPTQEAAMDRGNVIDKDGNVTVKVGDALDVYVIRAKGGLEVSTHLATGGFDPELLMEAQRSGAPVEGKVTGANTGGLEISVMGTRGFCPMGQVALDYVEEPKDFIGQTWFFKITEVKEGGRNVVLSRKAYLQAERKKAAAALLEDLQVGQVRPAKIVRLQKFGAFADLGGIDGLIPISELSHGRVGEVSDVVSEGQEVQVEILRIEDDPKRAGEKKISLSLRKTSPHPLTRFSGDLVPGTQAIGWVASLQSYGAFIELFEKGSGVEGLAHVSELSEKHVRHPSDVLEVGQEIHVRIKDVNLENERISLSLKEGDHVEGAPSEGAQLSGGQPTQRLGKGELVTGAVDRIESYGIFIQPEEGKGLFIHVSETGTPHGTQMRQAFALGDSVTAMVIDVDEKGRLKGSIKAIAEKEERDLIQQYAAPASSSPGGGGGGGGGGLGTFADLFNKKKQNKKK